MKNLHVAIIFIIIGWLLLGLVVGLSKKKNVLLAMLTGPFSFMLTSKNGNGVKQLGNGATKAIAYT